MEHSCKCCDLIFSLVQLLFAFVSIRIAKFSFSEKAVLATQSSMCLCCQAEEPTINPPMSFYLAVYSNNIQ